MATASSTGIASLSPFMPLLHILWDRGDELKTAHEINVRRGGDSTGFVLAPRAVLGERFYRSRSWPLSAGDGKNLARTSESPPSYQCQSMDLTSMDLTSLSPSSFGPRFGRQTAKPSL